TPRGEGADPLRCTPRLQRVRVVPDRARDRGSLLLRALGYFFASSPPGTRIGERRPTHFCRMSISSSVCVSNGAARKPVPSRGLNATRRGVWLLDVMSSRSFASSAEARSTWPQQVQK